jgi:hypothetical protein
MSKIVVGTEIYMSERFSDLWLRAAKKNLPADVKVIVFDNNPYWQEESVNVRNKCAESFYKYVKLLPHCTLAHTAELLRQFALNEEAKYYLHMDADLPPLAGVFETMVKHVEDGAIAATELGNGCCFICHTGASTDMSCQRIPYRKGGPRSRFSDKLDESYRNAANGLLYFDHCQWMFHELERQGHRVDIVDYKFVHATVASFKKEGTQRLRDYDGNLEFQRTVKKAHAAFWNNEEIKELMCQK